MAKLTTEEIKRHNTLDSLWVIHNEKVYDVTPFAIRHPGGSDILMGMGGADVTSWMQEAPHVHSPAAYQILDRYLIGDLNGIPHSHTNGSSEKHTGIANENGHANVDNASSGEQYTHSESRDTMHTGGHSMHGWREDEIVNWNKPIFWQVGKLGKSYSSWVHSPVDRHIRLFYSDFVEFFSETPWWVIPLLWLPVLSTFLFFGIQNLIFDPQVWTQMPWISLLLSIMGLEPGSSLSVLVSTVTIFAFGILLWTWIEYVVHRWLFHLNPPHDSPFLITTHFILHGQHHKAPFDKSRLVFPPVPATAFAFTFWLVFGSFFCTAVTQILTAGTLLGYVCYDLTHYFLHHGRPYFNYFKRLKSYHVKHHFTDQQKGFGISSKLWDYPFNTLIPDDPIPTKLPNNNNKKNS